MSDYVRIEQDLLLEVIEELVTVAPRIAGVTTALRDLDKKAWAESLDIETVLYGLSEKLNAALGQERRG